MYAAGYNKYTSRQIQFDAGIRLDLAKVLKGLSFKTHFAVDYSTSYNTSINNEYSTYEASWNNAGANDMITELTKYGTDRSTGTQNMSGSYTRQTSLTTTARSEATTSRLHCSPTATSRQSRDNITARATPTSDCSSTGTTATLTMPT